MDKRWRTATWVLTTLLVAVVLWGGWQWTRRSEAEALQLAQQQRALYELIAQVEQTHVLLEKTNASGSDEQRVLHLTDAWRQAFGAQSNLNQLPLGRQALMRMSQLLAQTGDYAYVLARQTAAGEPLTEEQRETLTELQGQLGLVAEKLHDVIAEAAKGARLTWRELRDLTNARLADAPNGFRDGFDELGRQLVEFPTLIYDGPFSDHVMQREPKGLTGPDVGEEEAQDIARRFVEVEGDVHLLGEAEGVVPAWQVRLVRDAGVIDVDVSRQGGHVLWMLDSRSVGSPRLSEEEALARAEQFLEQRGHGEMTPTWVGKTEDRLIVPFVYVDDGVVIYPDMVKVIVALDDGQIIGYDALDAVMSRHDRTLPEPEVSEEEARAVVHDGLTPGDGRLALIPSESLVEVLTWEFPATAGDDQYVVYVNALTGREERILKLLDTEEGWLVL